MRPGALFIFATLFLLVSCHREQASSSPRALLDWYEALLEERDLAEAHYHLAKGHGADAASAPLLIWHLQEFLNNCTADDTRIDEVRLWLQYQEQNYYASLRQRLEPAAASDKDIKIRLLEESNQQLRQWISRLNRENFALRDMLLDKSGTPLAASNPKKPKGDTQITPTKPPVDMSRSHRVSAGDTLSKIAQIYYGSSEPALLRHILMANPELEKNPNQLRIGQRVIIPNRP
ncbi:MAG: LysM peptidoglycan-binding domain-containing protein [Oligosphaeraceae bacterium]|nr:LysM peptidoglycan-binding domain-containing protein [Oligosphaeraceae bacterium]